jgi:tRNA G18 (ribose-2'-O)-methylase SpoU
MGEPTPVEVADDPRVALFANLTDVDLRTALEPSRGIFMAEGMLIIKRCVQRSLEIVAVLTSPKWLDRLMPLLEQTQVPVYVGTDSVLESITGYRVHRGALAVVRRPRSATVGEILDSGRDILVLEDLVDPTNVGLAIRSAVVQGVSEVVLSPACADPLYRKAVKSSMGAVLRSRWARSDDWAGTLADLSRTRSLIALTPDADDDLADTLSEVAASPVALMVGSEGPGLSGRSVSQAWRRCSIPMATSEDSLNVAAAVAVACFARSRSMTA